MRRPVYIGDYIGIASTAFVIAAFLGVFAAIVTQ